MSQQLFNESKIGVCVKNQEKLVIHQNELCKKVCGERESQTCSQDCMSDYAVLQDKESIFNEGIRNIHHVTMENGLVDATLINDGQNITTLFYKMDDHQEAQLNYFKDKGLTKTEMNVMKSVLAGETNSNIAKSMFVSKATLKTHLNNIYKKIPVALKDIISRGRI